MAYIGREPQIGNFQICDAITVVDAQAAYTMQVDTVDVSPESANHMIVSLNGVIQKPTDAYTVSGSTITFASALETGDVIDFIQILGNVLDLGVPSDNTVTTAKLADSSVTTAKLNDASVTTAKLNDASVSLAKLTATGTQDATTFLRGDNTFAEVSLPIKKISTNSGIVTVYDGLTGGTHTLTDYNVTHTALSTSNKLAFIVNIPYANAVKPNLGIINMFINDGSSDVQSGLFYQYNAGDGIGEQSIHFQRWNHTPSSTSAITYTLKVEIYRPSGSETAGIGSAGKPADLIVMEY
jgi:hypothetical protein